MTQEHSARLYTASLALLKARDEFFEASRLASGGTHPVIWTINENSHAVICCHSSWLKVIRERLDGQPFSEFSWIDTAGKETS